MDALNTAIADVFADLPAMVNRSLTWDQGHEIARHAQLANTTGLDVYPFATPTVPGNEHKRKHQRPPAPMVPKINQLLRSLPH